MLDRVASRVDPVVEKVASLVKENPDLSVLNIGGLGMGVNDTFSLENGEVTYGRDFHLPRIKALVKDLVVVDIQADKAAELNKRGYSVLVQSADETFFIYDNNKLGTPLIKDITSFDINKVPCKKFDVEIAEEVIEHLQDMRVFLNNVKRHLKPGGLFIVTSPSPWGWAYLLQFIFFGKEFTNDQHNVWFSEKVMRHLLETNGFKVEKVRYIDAVSENTRGRILQNLLRWLPARFGINVVYEARLIGDSMNDEFPLPPSERLDMWEEK